MGKTIKYLVGLIFTIYNVMVCRVNCFNRKSTGVGFQPYVLNTTTNHFTIYTLEEVKTMLKVVSTKFSRVSTYQTSNTANYQENNTYYETCSEVYTAEAAALLNREANLTNNSINLKVYIGISLTTDPNKMNTEIKLAFEAVRKSNKIHPGTSVALILYHFNTDDNITIANLAIAKGQEMKNEAKLHNLKIGIKIYCSNYKSILSTPQNMRDSLAKAMVSFLRQFDFIICYRYCDDCYEIKVTTAIELVTKDLVEIRDLIHIVNPNIEFMAETRTSSFGSTEKHFKFLRDFWIIMDKWSSQNNISIWMQEAFDNPWKTKLKGRVRGEAGWWKVKYDLSLNDVKSYEEKVANLMVSEPSLNPGNLTTLKIQPDFIYKPSIIQNEKETAVWIYIGSIIGPIIAVVALALLVIQWCRTNNIRRQILTRDEIQIFTQGYLSSKRSDGENGNIEADALNKPYDKSIEFPKNCFQIYWSSILGSGEFGVVYKAKIMDLAKYNDSYEVALKMTKDNCPKSAVMSILSEIKILSYLGHHENLVSIKGAYTSEIAKGVVYVATEICELGSLKAYLRKLTKPEEIPQNSYENDPRTLNEPVKIAEMVRWSFEIACGMEYLAEKKVIHADLATRNVLLTADKTLKITDFGLSRRLYEYTNYVKKQQEPLPWRWMAIEALKKLEFSTESDVWSYGVTLWEIFSLGDVPYPGLSWTLEFVDNLENGLRMKCPRLASPEIFALMSSCWEQGLQNRPTFTQLKKSFARMVEINRGFF